MLDGACQEMMGVTDLFDLHPAVLKTDVAAIQARRALSKLIRIEQSKIAGSPAAAHPPS